ncbi:MAG: PEP-CTERM sorting domain-containing protein [Phycisphaeraceae bacterium]
MIRLTCALALSLSFILAPASLAQEWGAQSTSGIGDIRSTGGQSNFTFDSAGGAGIPIADTELNDAVSTDFSGNGPWDRGLARGFTGLTFAGNQPNPMRSESTLTGNLSQEFKFGSFPAGAVASNGVFVSDIFLYTGNQPGTITLNYSLEGTLVDSGGFSGIADPLTFIRAQVAVFADTPQYRFLDDVPTLTLEEGATLKQDSLGNDAYDQDALFINNDTGGVKVTQTTSLTFDVVPGETFYVWQTLRTSAAFGTRSADAWGTLTGSFDQPGLVTSLSAPEPASAALLALGGLLSLRRR